MRKLCKNIKEGKITGVCAGLSDYLQIDVSIIRTVWTVCAITGVGLIAYLAAAVIIPAKDEKK